MEKRYLCPTCDSVLDIQNCCSHCSRNFSENIEKNSDVELTQVQIDAQDHIDNLCFGFIKEFVPDCDWDIAQISVIRDALINVLVENHGFNEYDIYPWLIETEGGI